MKFHCYLFVYLKKNHWYLTLNKASLFLVFGRAGIVTRYKDSKNSGGLSLTSVIVMKMGVTEESCPSETVTHISYSGRVSLSRVQAVVTNPATDMNYIFIYTPKACITYLRCIWSDKWDRLKKLFWNGNDISISKYPNICSYLCIF